MKSTSVDPQVSAAQRLAEYEWLVGPQAAPLLESMAEHADPLTAAQRLRGGLSPERVHLVLEQVRLRAHARKKFALANRLFFTSQLLEQATDGWTASYKAARFAAGKPVQDFCSGIGGDLMALAARGPVVGIDRDPVAALLAQTNCDVVATSGSALRLTTAARVETSATSTDLLDPQDQWHIDPDRRPAGRRTTQVELHDPPAATIDALLARSASGAVKLAPAAEPPAHWEASAELEWISLARECRQLVAWFGPLSNMHGRRRATLLDRAGVPQRTVVGRAGVELDAAARIGRYVYEPDAAILAANLTGALAAEWKLAAIAPGAVYLTADSAVHDAALAGFEVLDVLPFDVKRLKKLLRAGGFGRLEVKKRGVPHDPAAVARQLKVPGDHTAALLIARVGKPVVAIVARRLQAGAEK